MKTPLRIGLIGLDTSHVTAFTTLLNDTAHPHHVSGARVVAGYSGGSDDFPLSRDRVAGFTAELRDQHGVEILPTPEAVADAVDLVFVEAVDGRTHLDLFRRIIRFAKPTFIDKPMATTLGDAREIFDLAGAAGVPVMSASSLRYAAPLLEALNAPGEILGCDAFGPMPEQPTQPGWLWYGIHTVEMVVAAMGAGCRRVQGMRTGSHDLLSLEWSDGRIASIHGIRDGHSRFGITLHRKNGFSFVDAYSSPVPPYAGLLQAILGSLPHGHSAIGEEHTLEVMRIVEMANAEWGGEGTEARRH